MRYGHPLVAIQREISSRGFARMNADESRDQNNSTHLISSFFRSGFIRADPPPDQFLARALHLVRFGMLITTLKGELK